jgi:hypothetical protein
LLNDLGISFQGDRAWIEFELMERMIEQDEATESDRKLEQAMTELGAIRIEDLNIPKFEI